MPRIRNLTRTQRLEIADRDTVPFLGFDPVRLPFQELKDMVEDHRYADWPAALSQAQATDLLHAGVSVPDRLCETGAVGGLVRSGALVAGDAFGGSLFCAAGNVGCARRRIGVAQVGEPAELPTYLAEEPAVRPVAHKTCGVNVRLEGARSLNLAEELVTLALEKVRAL